MRLDGWWSMPQPLVQIGTVHPLNVIYAIYCPSIVKQRSKTKKMYFYRDVIFPIVIEESGAVFPSFGGISAAHPTEAPANAPMCMGQKALAQRTESCLDLSPEQAATRRNGI